MSLFTFAILFILIGAICSFIHLGYNTHRKTHQKLPPSPPSLPIFGNLLMLGNLPHRTLQDLAKTYGPIMSIRLGFVPAIVVSSPEATKLFLKTHDKTFANRPKRKASELMAYGSKSVAFLEYGPEWYGVRKLFTMELLSESKINSYVNMRATELNKLMESLKEAATACEVVDLSDMVWVFIEDTICRMLFGQRNDQRFDLKTIVQEGLALTGAFNIADFVPFLGVFDVQGLNRRMKAIGKAIDKIMEILIDEHEQDANMNEQTHHKDFISVKLSLMRKSSSSHNDPSYSIDRTNIKSMVVDMIGGSMDTSSTAIDWILTELLRHPRVMKKLQEELNSVVGERMVEETDLVKLEYLDMVIKESLRLHPVAPLITRESIEETTIDEYFIPKKSTIIVNSWAIGRDPNVWSENAEEFLPERFSSGNVDLHGHHFQFLPFGTGRRVCSGIHLALTNVRLVVAQLVHCFDWKLPEGMTPNELDMSEKFGITLRRAKHLLAIPTYRLRGKNFSPVGDK